MFVPGAEVEGLDCVRPGWPLKGDLGVARHSHGSHWSSMQGDRLVQTIASALTFVALKVGSLPFMQITNTSTYRLLLGPASWAAPKKGTLKKPNPTSLRRRKDSETCCLRCPLPLARAPGQSMVT